jgi:hypothetical protein
MWYWIHNIGKILPIIVWIMLFSSGVSVWYYLEAQNVERASIVAEYHTGC